jgi:MraZ protein
VGIGVSLYRNMTVNNSIGFLGEYEVSIDAKNRFLVPAGFRKQLPEGAEDRFVINRGFENCLTVYTLSLIHI